MVSLLLKHGADPLIVATRGETALRCALASDSPESAKTDELLIAAGGLEQIPFPFGCIESSRTSVAHINVLLQNSVDPNLTAPDGTTPLMLFSENGDTPAVSRLVDHGARINAVSADGETALSKAINGGNDDVVQYLIQHGADATIRVKGKTLLEIAKVKLADVADAPAAVPHYQRVVSLLAPKP